VYSVHRAEIEALHREECPGAPWVYEMGCMVFPDPEGDR
jgi:hypothetical protein